MLLQLNEELTRINYFVEHKTDYVLLDAEIMPWNLKAKEWISSQYAHVAENAVLDRSLLKEKLSAALPADSELQIWLDEYEEKL